MLVKILYLAGERGASYDWHYKKISAKTLRKRKIGTRTVLDCPRQQKILLLFRERGGPPATACAPHTTTMQSFPPEICNTESEVIRASRKPITHTLCLCNFHSLTLTL